MSAPTIDDRPIEERPARVDFGDRGLRRRRLLRTVLMLLGLLVAAAVAWIVFFSSLLAVSSVRVDGAEGARAEQVLAAAAVPIGTAMLRLDTSAAQAGVMALPWVAGVEVRRGWPNQVVLAVTARQPIAAMAGTASAVDANGVIFDAVVALPKGLPTVSADGVGLEAAMDVLSTLPADIAAKVVSISATTRDNVVLSLKSGAVIRWGSAEKSQFKAEVLRALLRLKRDVYDVTAPELPTTFKASSSVSTRG